MHRFFSDFPFYLALFSMKIVSTSSTLRYVVFYLPVPKPASAAIKHTEKITDKNFMLLLVKFKKYIRKTLT